MKNYVITLMGVIILSGIIQMLSPEGDIKRYINLLAGLAVVCVIIAPVGTLLSAFREEEGRYFDKLFEYEGERAGYEEIFRENLKNQGAAAAAAGLENKISEKFGVKREDFQVHISLSYEGESMEANRVTVIIKNHAMLADPHEIKEFINTVLDCPCEIIYA